MNKIKNNQILLIIFFLCYYCNISNLGAITSTTRSVIVDSMAVDFKKITRKQKSIKNDKKLTLKERISFWRLKRKYRKMQRQERKLRYVREVEVELMDDRIIEGRFLKVENDTLYLINEEVEKIDVNAERDDLVVIPLTEIATIRKKPKDPLIGVLLGLGIGFLGLLARGLAIQNEYQLPESDFKEQKFLGTLLILFSAVVFTFSVTI